jgi:hypothetical protein
MEGYASDSVAEFSAQCVQLPCLHVDRNNSIAIVDRSCRDLSSQPFSRTCYAYIFHSNKLPNGFGDRPGQLHSGSLIAPVPSPVE